MHVCRQQVIARPLPHTRRKNFLGGANYSPDTRDTRQMQANMLDRNRFGQAEDELSTQMGAGSFLLTTAKDNVVLVEADVGRGSISRVRARSREAGNSPDVKVLCVTRTAAAAEETERHGSNKGMEDKKAEIWQPRNRGGTG